MNTNYSASITGWQSKAGQDYLSHATNNYEALFNEGKLLSAEEVLAKSGACECEINPQQERGIVTKAIVPEETNTILRYEKKSKKTTELIEVYIVPKYCKHVFPASTPVKDHGLFSTYKMAKAILPNAEIKPQDDPDGLFALLDELCPQAVLSVSQLKMEVISSSAENNAKEVRKEDIEKTIRAIWNYTQKKKLASQSALLDFRDATFGLRKAYIRSEIRTAKNRVLWEYGCVALIIGKAKEKLFSEFPLGMKLLPFHESRSDGCEFYLKAPFQVESGHYSEPLDAEENLVLGPKKILDMYREKFPKANFVNIEDLNADERKLFTLTR